MRNLRNEVRRIVQEELSHNRARLTESVITEGNLDSFYFVEYAKTPTNSKIYKGNLSWNAALAVAENLSQTLYDNGRLGTDVNFIGIDTSGEEKFAIIYINELFLNNVRPNQFGNHVNYIEFKKAAQRFLSTNRTSYGEYVTSYREYI